MVSSTCTDKLCTAATVHFLYEQSDLYMLVTTKALLVAVTRAQVNRLIVSYSYCTHIYAYTCMQIVLAIETVTVNKESGILERPI